MVVVQGINIRKNSVKPQQGKPGAIIDVEKPVHISNVALAVDGKPVRLKARMNKEGVKEIYYLWDGKEVIHRELARA
jgi:hypothetical protein